MLNHLHSYGNRLTTSSVADTDATDPHFLVDGGASIHLISQSLVDEGYLQICREWAVNERCTTANGQEMILNRCVGVSKAFTTPGTTLYEYILVES